MELLRPATLQEALEALAIRAGRAKPLAGGTDLVVRMKDGVEHGASFISLARCVELHGIREEGDELVVGAMSTHEEIARSIFLRRLAPVLCDAAAEVGSVQIRERGTIGGNVVNASPAADLVPPLQVLDAKLVLRSSSDERRLPIELFAQGPKATQLRPDELLVEVRFPRPLPAEIQLFQKVGARRALACAKISLAFRARVDGEVLRGVRIAWGAVAPTVVRAREAEAVLEGSAVRADVVARAVDAALAAISPIDDVRSTAWYRRTACAALLRRALGATLLS